MTKFLIISLIVAILIILFISIVFKYYIDEVRRSFHRYERYIYRDFYDENWEELEKLDYKETYYLYAEKIKENLYSEMGNL